MLKKNIITTYNIRELPFFNTLSESLFNDLMNAFMPIRIYCGEELFHEGDDSADLFLIVTGRLSFFKDNKKINELGRGELIGELAILTQRPRAATVIAVRDTLLLKLSKQAFDDLFSRYPNEFMPLIRSSIMRLINSDSSDINSNFNDFFVFLDCKKEISKNIVALLASELQKYGSCKIINKEEINKFLNDQPIVQSLLESENPIDSWLTKQQLDHKFIIYEADRDYSSWTQKCLRQCDRALIFCDAQNNGIISHAAKEVFNEAKNLKKSTDLIIIHPDETVHPSNTIKWLQQVPEATWHHIRQTSLPDFQRFVRIISGNSVTLVLGGGGAPALVYIGVYKALVELGIPIDWIGGTCAGSLLGSLFAMRYSPDDIIKECKKIAPNGTWDIIDPTIPLISIISGGKIEKAFKNMYGELQVEDLWIKFFSISTNISKYKIEVIQKGAPLWETVRSSIGIPVVMHPVTNENGDLLVDGAIVNNLPVDIMREFIQKGKIIAFKMLKSDLAPMQFSPTNLSFWSILKRIFTGNLKFKQMNVIEILDRSTMMASRTHSRLMSKRADACIELEVQGVTFFDFAQVDRLVEQGYQTIMENAETLQNLKG